MPHSHNHRTGEPDHGKHDYKHADATLRAVAFKNRAVFGLLISIGLLLACAAVTGWLSFGSRTKRP